MATSEQRNASNMVTLLTIQGIVAILFGLAAVFWPGITLVTLVYIFSAFILVTGIAGLIASLANFYDESRSALSRILLGLLSLLEIGVGVYLIRHVYISAATLILIIGFTLIAMGVLDVVRGLFDREESGGHRILKVVVGALAGLAGVIILMHPASGGVAFVWVVGLYALITGPLLIAMAMSLKREVDDAKMNGKNSRA